MQARCRDRRRAGSRRPMLLTLGHHESQCLTDSEESRAHYLSAEGHLSCIISQRLSLCCFGRLFAMCSPKTMIMLATKREQTRKNAVWPYDHYLILRDGHHHQSLTIKVSIIVVMPVTPRRSRSHSQTVICTRRVPSASQPASQPGFRQSCPSRSQRLLSRRSKQFAVCTRFQSAGAARPHSARRAINLSYDTAQPAGSTVAAGQWWLFEQ